jgi:AraC-like DNA-binding protein
MNHKHKTISGSASVVKLPRLPHIEYAGRYHGNCSGRAPTQRWSELMLLKRGHYEIRMGAQWFGGDTRDLFVVSPGLPQFKRAAQSITTSFVLFYAPPQFDVRPRVVTLRARPNLQRWIEDLCDCFESPAQRGSATALLCALLESLAALEGCAATPKRHPALEKAVEFLESNLHRACSMHEVAVAAHVSMPHLTMLFRTVVGCPPLQYQQHLRIARAQMLLGNPYMKIHEIAAACGYPDANYFLRLFRKKTGVSPGRWRKRVAATRGYRL